MLLVIELFGYFTLTLLGFVLPIVIVLMNLFHEGFSRLSVQGRIGWI